MLKCNCSGWRLGQGSVLDPATLEHKEQDKRREPTNLQVGLFKNMIWSIQHPRFGFV